MNQCRASMRKVIRPDGEGTIDQLEQADPCRATDLLAVRDVRRMADIYRALVQRGQLGVCRSIPLELVLAMLTCDDMLVPLEKVLAKVDAPETLARRWLDVLLDKKVLALVSMGGLSYVSLTPDFAAQFEFDI